MQNQRIYRPLLLLSLMLGVAGLTAVLLTWSGTTSAAADVPTTSAAACVGDNLLVNPGFEGDYTTYEFPPPGHPDCQTWDESKPNQFCERAKMPAGWHPRWLPDGTREFLIMPEFTASTPDQVNPDRVRSGGKSLHYWSFWQQHEAVAFQQVTAVLGLTYCFSAWGHAWSDRNSLDYYSATPDRPIDDGQLYQRVGIDPTGGTDWQADTVIWGPERKQYDIFGEFTVSATAVANQVTVFVYSRTGAPVKHNEVYWDDASLQANAQLIVGGTGMDLMAAVAQPVSTTATFPVQVTVPAYTWTAVLDDQRTITPTITIASSTMTATLSSAGLATGVYTATVNIASSQPVYGSPVQIYFTVYVVDDVFPTYLPAISRP